MKKRKLQKRIAKLERKIKSLKKEKSTNEFKPYDRIGFQ